MQPTDLQRIKQITERFSKVPVKEWTAVHDEYNAFQPHDIRAPVSLPDEARQSVITSMDEDTANFIANCIYDIPFLLRLISENHNRSKGIQI